MIIVAKMIRRKLANQIHVHTKKTIHHDQVDFIPMVQGWLNIYKSVNVIHHRKRLKDRNLMIIIDTEMAFDKIQHGFITKAPKKLGIGKTNPSTLKAICNKPNGGKSEPFSLAW